MVLTMPVSHTFELSYALGTLFLEIRGWFVEKHNVTLRSQSLDGSIIGDPWDHSLGPLICVTDMTLSFVFLFGHSSVITFIGLSVLTCTIYTILSRAKVLYVPKWTPLEISHFGFMGYPWVLRSDHLNQ